MIEPEVIRALAQAGVTAEQIALAIEVDARVSAAKKAAKRAGDAERQQRKRERDSFTPDPDLFMEETERVTQSHAESRVTPRDESADQQKEVPTPLRKTTFSELPSGSSSKGANAPQPIYSDSRHELWGEGVPILRQLGLSERDARSNIGRWLKDFGDDSATVLGAIQRARDHRIIDPIPWITKALTPNSVVVKFNAPRPGSREETRERTVNALDQLRSRTRGQPGTDDQATGREIGRSIVGGLPPAQPA